MSRWLRRPRRLLAQSEHGRRARPASQWHTSRTWLLAIAAIGVNLLLETPPALGEIVDPPRRMEVNSPDRPKIVQQMYIQPEPIATDAIQQESLAPGVRLEGPMPLEGEGGLAPDQRVFGRPAFEDFSPSDGSEAYVDDGPLYDPAPPFVNKHNPDRILGPQIHQQGWRWTMLPTGLIYRAYLAGAKEARMGVQWMEDKSQGSLLNATLGARVGIIRFGTNDPMRPQGWQWDVEGAAQPRLEMDQNWDLESADFRGGTYLTHACGVFEQRLGYYHISSHAGDEYMVRTGFQRINYVRDSLVLGLAMRPTEPMRIYAEADYAFHTDGGAEPWEFLFGVDLSPLRPTHFKPDPFFAINGQLRQELAFGGNLVVQAGAQWRSNVGGQLLRIGAEYYNGKSRQWEFFNQFEEQIGGGIWYDF